MDRRLGWNICCSGKEERQFADGLRLRKNKKKKTNSNLRQGIEDGHLLKLSDLQRASLKLFMD